MAPQRVRNVGLGFRVGKASRSRMRRDGALDGFKFRVRRAWNQYHVCFVYGSKYESLIYYTVILARAAAQPLKERIVAHTRQAH